MEQSREAGHFGTPGDDPDMTQMTFGYSRDDAEGKFLTHYLEKKLLPYNPFQVLDTEGVGQLIELAANAGRSVKPRRRKRFECKDPSIPPEKRN